MEAVANVVDAILTAILQWRVAWLEEQKKFPQPPPLCRSESRKLKITYDNYKDYETTFVPLLMHEIWAQIYEQWLELEMELSGISPMEVDDASGPSSNPLRSNGVKSSLRVDCPRQFWIGVADYRIEGQHQCLLKCQYLVESNKLNAHLKIVGEGDLVRLDLAAVMDGMPNAQFSDFTKDPIKKENYLSLFAYVVDVTSERITPYTTLAECFVSKPTRSYHVVNYQVVIARRQLKLKLNEPMKISRLYYLKPMIRQIESVANLKESALASDILSPKHFTCQLSIPTVVTIKSSLYNDMQYKAIVGANEALTRSIPKIQLIQGPPGTGKTHTLIGIIKHFYSHWTEYTKLPKLLICAPSNGAIDEVGKRLYREREFLKKTPVKRSLRMVRVGNPDQVSESVKNISLDSLVDCNANFKIEENKKKNMAKIKSLEEELSQCDTEITNLKYTNRRAEIPKVEAKIARLLKDLEKLKANEDLTTKREASEAAKRNMRYELLKNADVILTTLNSCQRHPLDTLFRKDNSELSFHGVIVDEASQCCEPELLMPLCYKIFRMILIGDPMQLPATVISRHAQDYNFGRSLFERFFIHFGEYNPSSPVAMLTDQYRMHPDICRFPSTHFYDGRLINARFPPPFPLKPYIVFDLRHGAESRSGKSSIENEAEAELVRNLLLAVMTKTPENSSIGVITPYKSQKRLITNKIRNLQEQRCIKVDVNTCDGFQGQERDVIVLSCVRAFDLHYKASVGFLKSIQRINVALTRAKHCLIICISAKSLSSDKTWKALVDDASERKLTQTLTQTPSSSALVSMIVEPIQARNNHRQAITNGSSNNALGPDYMVPVDMDID